jgi:hypothetical protein
MGRKRPHTPSSFIPHLAGGILDDPILSKDGNDPFDMSRIHAPDIASQGIGYRLPVFQTDAHL